MESNRRNSPFLKEFVSVIVYSTLFCFLSAEQKFTFEVSPATEECFFEEIPVGTQLKVNFQVLSGGNFDIGFSIFDPFNFRMAYNELATSKMHDVVAHVSGAYKFCFDNSHTEYFSKSVYFDLIYENNTSEEDRFNVSVEHNSEFENQLTGLKEKIEKIHLDLKKVTNLQNIFSAIEARTRSIGENNFVRVNFLSALQLSVLLASALLYIYLIRNLFSADYRSRSKMKT